MAKKAYISVPNFVPRELPEGYTQVEYIESSGTQYIDTGFKHNQDTRVIMDAQVTTQPSTHAWLFEGRIASSSAAKSVFLLSGTTWNSDYNTSTGNRKVITGVNITDRLSIDYNKNNLTVNSFSTSWTATTFQSTVNLTLLAANTNGTVAGFISAKLYSCKIYDNGTLVRDYVPCKNSSSVVGLYDIANDTFYKNAGTGTFTAGPIYRDVARKIKKGYVSVDGKARKIKKAYISIGGVARPCWSGGELVYYGTITEFSNKWLGAQSATSVGNYALFGGAQQGDTVNAYDKSLVRSVPTALSQTRTRPAAVSIGNYALFAGGALFSNSYSTVDAYDQALTRTTATSASFSGGGAEGANNGVYAVIYGSSLSTTVTAYNTSLTKSTAESSYGRQWVGAVSVGKYALLGGGISGGVVKNNVDAFDTSLTRTAVSNVLRVAVSGPACTSVGKYALFAGGQSSQSVSSAVAYANAYDASLTRTAPADLSASRYTLGATSVEGFALFGGGVNSSGNSAVVDSYDASLTLKVQTSLSKAKQNPPATSVGSYALFGGTLQDKTVDAFVVA